MEMILNQLVTQLKNTLKPQFSISSLPVHVVLTISIMILSLVSAQAFFAYFVYLSIESLEYNFFNYKALICAGLMVLETILFYILTKFYIKQAISNNVVNQGYESIKGVAEAFLRGYKNQ